jgi:2-polyprenyl-3-methyl-5-hydroxy-6-metoxy-1,4-benzoquinol methylase
MVIHHAPEDFASLMEHADLAITGGGTTCNELLFFGVPIGVLIIAENQEQVGRVVEHYGCGKSLGRYDLVSDNELLLSIRNLVENTRCLSKMSSNCKKLVDGKGGQRIADFINNFLLEYHEDQYCLQEVAEEYESASFAHEEYAKAKWGSHCGMLTRFRLAAHLVDKQTVDSWLDVGCGTGNLLHEVEKTVCIDRFVGVDFSKSLVSQALAKIYKTPSSLFFCQNFMDLISHEPFDVVTCIGLLQKCGVPLRNAVARLASLVRPGGQLFVTTKNLDWRKFKEVGCDPCKEHHWFRLAEIRESFFFAGLRILAMNGFEPRDGIKPIPLEDAHSIYVLAEKP